MLAVLCSHSLEMQASCIDHLQASVEVFEIDVLCSLTDKPLEAVTGAPLAEAAEEAMVAAGGDPADGPTPEEEAEAEAKVPFSCCSFCGAATAVTAMLLSHLLDITIA